MRIEIHYDDEATYSAFLISADGRTKQQFAIVPGKSIPEMLKNSTAPLRLKFERIG